MLKKLSKLFRGDERGQGMVEYGLILSLVAVVAVFSLSDIGDTMLDTLKTAKDNMGVENVSNLDGTTYSNSEIDQLVSKGYVPVATIAELDSLRYDIVRTHGKGTRWEGEFNSGLDKKYILVSDLDLSSFENFEPIGSRSIPFKGDFDGGGHIISNLTVSRGGDSNVGLFGRVNDSNISNVRLRNVNIFSNSQAGGLVGFSYNSSVVNSSVSGGDIRVSTGYAGGLVGYQSNNSSIKGCFSNIDVSGGQSKNSASSVGGLVGYQREYSTIENSYALGSVAGPDEVGGLVGRQDDSTTSNSYAAGKVNAYGSYTGGLVGWCTDIYSTVGGYYDRETTGKKTARGGVAKSTLEMKDQYTFEGWDFDSVWQINDGYYPTLQWE